MTDYTDYIVTENIILKELVGEYVLIPVGDAAAHFPAMNGLNESAAFVWKKLAEGLSTAEILDCVAETYELDKESAEEPLLRILAEMCTRGYIREK